MSVVCPAGAGFADRVSGESDLPVRVRGVRDPPALAQMTLLSGAGPPTIETSSGFCSPTSRRWT